jgi:hypothetical protein
MSRHLLEAWGGLWASRLAAALILGAAVLGAASVLPKGTRAADSSRDKVSFYFAAHEDDWQLFMNPSAFVDVADPKAKTVFVHTTAGDAGLGIGMGGRKHPYYLARENGAETAIRFMADSGEQPANTVESRPSFNGHHIYRLGYRNTAAYFLRLPDGHPSGSGFPGTGHQSLERLAKGEISALSAIDGSAIYRGWNDLVTTIRAILDYDRGEAASVNLNVAERLANVNPEDHSDHQMTAKAAIEAAGDLACARRSYYVDYASAKLPENLDPQERDMESSVLAVTAAGILALDHTSIWARYYRSYLGRNYFRVENGTGQCREPMLRGRQAAAIQPLDSIGKR